MPLATIDMGADAGTGFLLVVSAVSAGVHVAAREDVAVRLQSYQEVHHDP